MTVRHILLLPPGAPSCPGQVIVVKSGVIFRDGSVTTGFSTRTEKCREDLVTEAKYARMKRGYMTYPDSSHIV